MIVYIHAHMCMRAYKLKPLFTPMHVHPYARFHSPANLLENRDS